ncbi:hypothetical protein BH09MYX1_BH09MYX1_55890 [soil metagenome]
MSTTSSRPKTPPPVDRPVTAAPPKPVVAFASATHAILFETESATQCTVCGDEITEDDGARVSGSGLLVFARGDDVRYEEPRLCDACATAVGITQHRLWDLEDDEEG